MPDLAEELLPDVLLSAPGCPDITAERAIARSVRQLCIDTHVWRHDATDRPVIEGVREVSLGLPADTSLVKLYWVTLGMRPLTGVSAAKLTVGEGTPRAYALSASGKLELDRVPNESVFRNGITAHMALAPVRGSSQLPEELEPFYDLVTLLATAHLLSMPGVEWRDRAGAADAMALYHQRSLEARRFGNQRGQPIHRTVKYGGL